MRKIIFWDGFFMRESNRETGSADLFLPARFDWSIMGCTILLLALMNLEKSRGERERERETDFKSPGIQARMQIHPGQTQRQNSFSHDLMATLAIECLSAAPATKQQQTKGQLWADLGAQRRYF